MDVTFSLAPAPLEPHILLQQMVEYQNSFNMEYNNTLNEIIVEWKSDLEWYLQDNHNHLHRLAIPNRCHVPLVKNSLKDIALLLSESEDIEMEKLGHYKKLQNEVSWKVSDYRRTISNDNDSSRTLEEKRAILESIQDSVGAMIQKRLDCERQYRTLILRIKKLIDLAKTIRTADAGGDVLLAMLRMGILSTRCQEVFQVILESMRTSLEIEWPHAKKFEDRVLEIVNDQLKLIEAELELHEPKVIVARVDSDAKTDDKSVIGYILTWVQVLWVFLKNLLPNNDN